MRFRRRVYWRSEVCEGDRLSWTYMMKPAVIGWLTALLSFSPYVLGQSEGTSSSVFRAVTRPRRVLVNPDVASSLVIQKAPITYPESSRSAGIEGKVVLKIVTSISGDVEDVAVVSGDPGLTQAAMDSVQQWKYKPYLLDGSPAEMETEVSVNFHLKAPPQVAPPPLGSFSQDTYINDYFGIHYPLSPTWVRETQAMRKKLATEGKTTAFVLLAAVHIPQNSDVFEADSSFTLLAMTRSGATLDDCKRTLEATAAELQTRKGNQLQGELSQLSTAGHTFYRANFRPAHGGEHRAALCTAIKDYLLEWNISGSSKESVESAVSTLNAITAAAPKPAPETEAPPPIDVPKSAMSPQDMVIKKVPPVYPQGARHDHIEGTVVMSAVISKEGNVSDVEVLDGPLELAVSAVNAVRQWKYRPYLQGGQPVDIRTQVQVNYELR